MCVCGQNNANDSEPELSLKQQIRQEFDETFDSVKEFGTMQMSLVMLLLVGPDAHIAAAYYPCHF